MRRTVMPLAASMLLVLSGCSRSGSSDEASDASAPVTAADLHPCKVTATELTDEDCAAAQYWLDQAKQGTASFAAPKSMIQGQSRLVTLAIGTAPPPVAATTQTTDTAKTTTPDNTTADAANSVSNTTSTPTPTKPPQPTAPDQPSPHDVAANALSGQNGTIIDYHPFVGRQVAADLEGDGFDITPISPRVQPVADNSVTTWSWRVKANAYGAKMLILKTAVAMIDSQGKADLLVPTTENKQVKVYIGPQGVLDLILGAPAWLKALTGLIAASGGLYAAFRAFGRREPSPPKT